MSDTYMIYDPYADRAARGMSIVPRDDLPGYEAAQIAHSNEVNRCDARNA